MTKKITMTVGFRPEIPRQFYRRNARNETYKIAVSDMHEDFIKDLCVQCLEEGEQEFCDQLLDYLSNKPEKELK